MEVQVDILGSFVCRDIFRYIPDGEYKINRCISSVPITTLYEESIPVHRENFESSPMTSYEKRMLKIQLKGVAAELLKKSGSRILIIDLAEELLKRYQVGPDKNSGVAYRDEYEEHIPGFFQKAQENATISAMDLDLAWINEKYKRFAKDIVYSENNPMGYQEKNIILIESLCTEKIIVNGSGTLKVHADEEHIKAKNEWLKKLYGLFLKYIPECRVISLPEFTYSSEHNLRGNGPFCYTEETYRYFADCLNVICGKAKFNSVENLWKEQSFKNRILGRTLNSGSIYSIGPMKKQIKELQKQIADLKAELSKLKGED